MKLNEHEGGRPRSNKIERSLRKSDEVECNPCPPNHLITRRAVLQVYIHTYIHIYMYIYIYMYIFIAEGSGGCWVPSSLGRGRPRGMPGRDLASQYDLRLDAYMIKQSRGNPRDPAASCGISGGLLGDVRGSLGDPGVVPGVPGARPGDP